MIVILDILHLNLQIIQIHLTQLTYFLNQIFFKRSMN